MAEQGTTLAPYSKEFLTKVKEFKKDWHKKYKDISKEPTPAVDGTGKKIINKKGSTGFDYIEESYMRECLDKHFPGWSLEMAAPLHFLGAEWVVAQLHLSIIDEFLVPFGFNPPIRKFYGVDSVRIQYKQNAPHNPENIVDVGDNCKQAVTSALKYAINRMTHIGDDIYGKRVEEEGAGSLEEVMAAAFESGGGATEFGRWVTENKWSWGDIMQILGVKSMTEVTDYGEAYKKVKKAKELE